MNETLTTNQVKVLRKLFMIPNVLIKNHTQILKILVLINALHPHQKKLKNTGNAETRLGKERIKAWDTQLQSVYGIPNLSINAKKEKNKKFKPMFFMFSKD